jgi:hypothetical protein
MPSTIQAPDVIGNAKAAAPLFALAFLDLKPGRQAQRFTFVSPQQTLKLSFVAEGIDWGPVHLHFPSGHTELVQLNGSKIITIKADWLRKDGFQTIEVQPSVGVDITQNKVIVDWATLSNVCIVAA